MTPTDAERFQFIARFRLHVAFHADHVTLMWQKRVEHWEASPPYYPVASGKTLEDATDAAIERYNRKHGLAPANRTRESGVVMQSDGEPSKCEARSMRPKR